MDRHGNYRLVETNDRDGGREVVLHGRELALALRYGKLVRRPAQEPEPTRYLEEALGGPWAAWELVRRFARVESADGRTFTLTRAASPRAPEPGEAKAGGPLRRWRGTVEVSAVDGKAELHPETGALLSVALEARFTLRRDETPLEGSLKVDLRTSDIGETPVLAPPLAEDLPVRQRTIQEEKALLGRSGEAGTGAGGPKRSK
jgi:hypothetical protein